MSHKLQALAIPRSKLARAVRRVLEAVSPRSLRQPTVLRGGRSAYTQGEHPALDRQKQRLEATRPSLKRRRPRVAAAALSHSRIA